MIARLFSGYKAISDKEWFEGCCGGHGENCRPICKLINACLWVKCLHLNKEWLYNLYSYTNSSFVSCRYLWMCWVVGWTAVSSLHLKCLVYFFHCWMVYWVVLWKGNFLLIIQRVFYFNMVILSFQLNNFFVQISEYGVICIINDCKEFWPCYSYNAHNIASFRYWFPSSRKVGTCCKLIIKGILDAIAFL